MQPVPSQKDGTAQRAVIVRCAHSDESQTEWSVYRPHGERLARIPWDVQCGAPVDLCEIDDEMLQVKQFYCAPAPIGRKLISVRRCAAKITLS